MFPGQEAPNSLDLLVDGSLTLRVEGDSAQTLTGGGLVHSGELALDLYECMIDRQDINRKPKCMPASAFPVL